MRPEVTALLALGTMPSEDDAEAQYVDAFAARLEAISRPVSDDEAARLVTLFGPPDSLFGLAWSLLHLIETAPGWPVRSCLEGVENEWTIRLRDRCQRAGRW